MPLWRHLESGGKRAAVAAHRRWGKDDVALHHTACKLHERVGVYWHLLPQASQARKAIWEAVNPHTGVRRIDEAFPLALRDTTRDNEMFIRFKTGSTWQVVGSDNFNSLVGSPPVGLVLSEFALANPSAWSYLRPILAENGGWALFISTYRGRNHFHQLVEAALESPDWYAEVSPVSKTKAVPQDVLDQELREYVRELGPDQGRAVFMQEWECSPDAAVMGAYYVGELDAAIAEARITSVPYDPAVPVYTYWDLGIDDATAIWFVQFVGKEIRLLEYAEWTQQSLSAIASEVMNRPYTYAQHIMPHDVRAREMTTGRTREEVMRSILGRVEVAPMQAVEDGINAVRTIFPRLWFDKTKCKDGIEALRNYRKDWDEKNKTFKPRPLHDWSSHCADALRQLGVTYREKLQASARPARYSNTGKGRRSVWV